MLPGLFGLFGEKVTDGGNKVYNDPLIYWLLGLNHMRKINIFVPKCLKMNPRTQ